MKRVLIFSIQILIINISLFSQKYEPVIVRAGMRVVDCFPFNERFRYPEFEPGKIELKSGTHAEYMMDYNFLSGDMDYILKRDTLAIANPEDIRFIVIAQDTFFYDKGNYLEQLMGGDIKVVLKQYIKLKEIQKQDSYGTTSAGSAMTSYGSLPANGNFYKLVANTDLQMQRTLEYYLSDPAGGFVAYTKKNVKQLFPENKSEIKAYLKSNKVNFDSREDLIRLADYLKTL